MADTMYAGGSANFDEKTGTYKNPAAAKAKAELLSKIAGRRKMRKQPVSATPTMGIMPVRKF